MRDRRPPAERCHVLGESLDLALVEGGTRALWHLAGMAERHATGAQIEVGGLGTGAGELGPGPLDVPGAVNRIRCAHAPALDAVAARAVGGVELGTELERRLAGLVRRMHHAARRLRIG